MTKQEAMDVLHSQVLDLHRQLSLIFGMERVDLDRFSEEARKAGLEELLASMFDSLQNQFRIGVRRFFDPERTGSNHNVSFKAVLKHLEAEGSSEELVSELKCELNALRELAEPVILSVRKVLAHSDLETVQTGEAIGGLSDGDAERLVDGIYEWLGKAGLSYPYGECSLSGAGRWPAPKDFQWAAFKHHGEKQAERLMDILRLWNQSAE